MNKKHLVIYYNPADIEAAKDARAEAKAAGHSAVLIDADAFMDIEQADGVSFVGNISAEKKTMIKEAYKPSVKPMKIFDPDAQSIVGDPRGLNFGGNLANGDVPVEIPEDWEGSSFAERQKLAAALSPEVTVRSSEAANEIIQAEVERRAYEAGSDQTLEGTGTHENADEDTDAEETDAEETEATDADDEDEVDLSGMTKAELMDYAETNEIDLGDAKNKADILAAIELARE